MKLLTLNTHSLEEPGYVEKTEKFIEMLVKEQPDIVALQEVNQSQNAAELPDVMLDGYTRCGGFELPVRADNHAAYVVKELRKRGIYYDWTWISAKTGYGKYDEGMALLSRKPITRVQQFLISKTDDYENWKTRRTLGIQPEGSSDCSLPFIWDGGMMRKNHLRISGNVYRKHLQNRNTGEKQSG